MTRLRCAILDDYFNCALTLADWSRIGDRVDVTVFNHPFASKPRPRPALLRISTSSCAMRERTPFPRSLFAALPKLKLLITVGHAQRRHRFGGRRRRTMSCCAARNATRDPTAPLTMGLILELTRNIGRESARMHAGEPWQKHIGIEIEGHTLGIVGLGKLGTKVARLAKAFGMNVIAWSPNLTPERCEDAGVGYATKEELFATADFITIHVVLSQRSRGLVGRDDLAAHEADRLSRQHRARAAGRRGRAAGGAAAEDDRGRRASTCSRPSRCQWIIRSASSTTRADAASRLRHRGELSRPLRPDGRGHRRLAQGRAAARLA